MLSIVVLISGRGSNLQALINALGSVGNIQFSAVIASRDDAAGLQYAQQAEIPTATVSRREFADTDSFSTALKQEIEQSQPALVVLAGFMHILSDEFVQHFADRLINIHPSLLPKFRGLNTHRRAIAEGVTEHGASVHYVNEELDGGPIIAQTIIDVRATDSIDELAARVLAQEHLLYPTVIQWIADGSLQCIDSKITFRGEPLLKPILFESRPETTECV